MTLGGDYHHIPGYWEWTEDILGRSQETLTKGILYEEVVSDAKELTGLDVKKVRYISRTCTKGDFIRPRTFKMECMMASERKVGLAIPVLDSIYSGLNKISFSARLDQIKTLMDIAGSTTVMHLGNSDKVPINKALITDVPPSSNAKLPNQHANKKSHTPSAIYEGKTPTQTTHISKRLSQDENESSSKDHCWKRVKVHFDDAKGISLPVVEIHDDTNNPLRTISALAKEPTNVTALQREGSYDSDESVFSPDLTEPPSTVKMGEGRTSFSCNEVKATLDSEICKLLLAIMLVFDGKKVVLDAQKNYISSLWTVIQGKILKCDVDCASSLEYKVQVIIKEMDCKDVDISPLRKLLHDFFDLATSYDQARSMLHDMNEEAAREELFYVVGERLTYAMLEEDEKDLKSLLEEGENEAKEAKLEFSVAAKEFDAGFDADLSNGVDQKKERLEAMHQDLINYKLHLD
ncbi:hypothetical protein BC332_01214 [Capsicum chinense]|nr:hypothetical protein BC332_01214 [Capsicum chinense]